MEYTHKKCGGTITKDISKTLTTSKRSPLKIESERGKDWYNSNFQHFLEIKNIQHSSRDTDKGPSIAETVIRSIRNSLEKPVFRRGNADWLSELPSVIRKYIKTIHHSNKLTPVQASKKVMNTYFITISKTIEKFKNQKFN